MITLDPFYYLANFLKALDWLKERYSDLLTSQEHEFIERFRALPKVSSALLVRMIMRKGNLFRASKLVYAEIGLSREAAAPLIELHWVNDNPLLTVEQLFKLFTKKELATLFIAPIASFNKKELFATLHARFKEVRFVNDWCADISDCVYHVTIKSLCDRLRLIFFGNLQQDWSEFVLAELGIFKYETVELSLDSRRFRTLQDVDHYWTLHQCLEQLKNDEPLDYLLECVPTTVFDSDWLERKRAKLLFKIAGRYEQLGELSNALSLYLKCNYPGARLRAIRVHELARDFGLAHELAMQAERQPENSAEQQQLLRIIPRLRRKLGLPKLLDCTQPQVISGTTPSLLSKLDLSLPFSQTPTSVEWRVRDHLVRPNAPVHYVENALINSLFGLLCWDAIFAPLPGAFFHRFHTGPADLFSTDFYTRRAAQFAACFLQLDSEQYRHTIVQTFIRKIGIQSPFVAWGMLSAELLDLALTCIPAAHLKRFFQRILLDIKLNRAGLPDLIQFWPQERRYQMIEVKGPGDRLQDNQVRWLDYCVSYDIPVAVCYVQWIEQAA